MRFARVLAISLSLCLCTRSSALRAEAFGVGFPEYEPAQNILDSKELLPTFVRLAVIAPLISDANRTVSGGDGQQYTLVSDAFNVSPDYRRWSFRIKSTARFSDRSLVRAEDIIFSLRRCGRTGPLADVTDLRGHSDRGVVWVEMEISQKGTEQAKQLLTALSSCPIVQRKSSISFGSDLGVGSNIVSGGPYIISAVVPGRKYILTRVRQSSIDREGLEQMELRSFKEWEQALAALRVGTIRALAWREANLDPRVRNDETLEVERCSDYWLIRRRSVTMNCIERLSVLEIRSNE